MRHLVRQGSRFVLIGIAATLAHFLTIVLLVEGAGFMGPTPATAIGSIFGIITAYSGNYWYVFEVDDARHHQYAPRFILVYVTVIAIHAGIMYLFVDHFELSYISGFCVATIISASLTFLANRHLIFAAHAVSS